MNVKRRAKITGTASYFPEKRLTNFDLEKMVDTSNEWIVERTGIKERRIAEKGVAASDLGAGAAKKLLEKTGTDPNSIDMILVPTVTPDMFFPSTACLIQKKIGASRAGGFDISAACSGFLYGLSAAAHYVESGAADKVLVVGTEKMSSILDYTDRNTCVLFGDGAGAVLVEPSAKGEEEIGIIDEILRIDGSGGEFLYMPGGGSLNPPTHETVDKKMHYVHQEGRQVFKFAVSGMTEVSKQIMDQNGLSADDIDLLVPHQANIRIMEAVGKRLGIPMERIAVNIHKYGNTTSATIPTCLDEYVDNGTLKKGSTALLTSFGAGFTWGAILLRWAY